MQLVGASCELCRRTVRVAKGAHACSACGVVFHRSCAGGEVGAGYREAFDAPRAVCPRCGDDIVARAADDVAREDATRGARIAAGRRTWLRWASVGSISHACIALSWLGPSTRAEALSLAVWVAWLLASGLWWVRWRRPARHILQGAYGVLFVVLGAQAAADDYFGSEVAVRAFGPLSHATWVVGGLALVATGVRLGTSAAVREYARAPR